MLLNEENNFESIYECLQENIVYFCFNNYKENLIPDDNDSVYSAMSKTESVCRKSVVNQDQDLGQ